MTENPLITDKPAGGRMSPAKWVAGIAAVAVVVLFLMPQQRLDELNETWRRLRGNPGQACLDYERKVLKDPYSARFGSYSVEPDNANHVIVKYHAKNSYGAYVEGEALCYVLDGEVSDQITRIARESVRLQKSIDRLEIESKCIDERNRLIRKGLEIEEATRQARKIENCESYQRSTGL